MVNGGRHTNLNGSRVKIVTVLFKLKWFHNGIGKTIFRYERQLAANAYLNVVSTSESYDAFAKNTMISYGPCDMANFINYSVLLVETIFAKNYDQFNLIEDVARRPDNHSNK